MDSSSDNGSNGSNGSNGDNGDNGSTNDGARITITVRQNGSYFIAGDDMARVRLVDHEGNEISTEGRKAISLCRCGGSTNKPFCDGTHSRIGFQGAIAAQRAFDAGRGAAQG